MHVTATAVEEAHIASCSLSAKSLSRRIIVFVVIGAAVAASLSNASTGYRSFDLVLVFVGVF